MGSFYVISVRQCAQHRSSHSLPGCQSEQDVSISNRHQGRSSAHSVSGDAVALEALERLEEVVRDFEYAGISGPSKRRRGNGTHMAGCTG